MAADTASTAGWRQWLWQLRLTQARAELALARDAFDEVIATATDSIGQSRARGRPKYEALGLITRARGLHALARTRDAIAEAHDPRIVATCAWVCRNQRTVSGAVGRRAMGAMSRAVQDPSR